jgi:hypothetical protein
MECCASQLDIDEDGTCLGTAAYIVATDPRGAAPNLHRALKPHKV